MSASCPDRTSGTAHITLAEGDNSIIVIKGANDLVMPKHIDTAWNVIAAADLVMLQHEIPLPTIDYIISKCAAAGITETVRTTKRDAFRKAEVHSLKEDK